MADGFDIHISPEQAAHLRAAAQTQGVDPADYARQLLEAALDAADPLAVSRARLAEYDRTGEFVPADRALADFKAAVERRRAARRG